jgi:diguanylate cyclase (GGDEF)-like protein
MATGKLGVMQGPVRSLPSRFFLATSGSVRVWMLTAILGGLAVLLGLLLVPDAPPASARFVLPWWLLLAFFYIAEAKVFHLHIGRSAHSFSMSEIPVAVGLILVAPVPFIIARMGGSAIALVVNRRQRSAKLFFNLAQFGLCSVTSVAIAHLAMSPGRDLGPALWAGVFAAVLTENVIGVLAVSTAITLAEGASQYRRIPEMLKIGVVVSITNTSLGLMILTVLAVSPEAAWLFAIPVVTAGIAYRAYITERQQHQSIQLLYESTRILQRSPEMDKALVSLLDHARKMFRGEVAEICLMPRRDGDTILRTRVGPGDAVQMMQPIGPAFDDSTLLRAVGERRGFLVERTPSVGGDGLGRGGALVAPLLGESTLIGTIVVADRQSEISTFDLEDLKLFETLASHTAVALENGQLEQSLEQLSRLKEELNHQASHDSLTGLANRALFTQAVARRLESTEADGRIPVVMFIDLDDFKLVNDSLGHTAGDTLLVAVGDRLLGVLRDSDMAARLGGDEFAILLSDEPDLTLAMRVANRLTAAMGTYFNLNGHDVFVRASIGVAAGRPGVDVAGDVLRNADVAMYSAKARGKGRVVVFEPTMHEALLARAQLSSDLEQAIASREFILQYQPIVELATGRIVSVEALVRWQHPTRGRVGPDDFIRVAEQTDAILDIGRWVLSEACRQVRKWRALVPSVPFTVSVNVSARELLQPTFVGQVLKVVREAGVDPAEIVLEMTETAMLQDWAATQGKLQEFRDAGIGISVDDFGTGYSSLSYLQRFPVTTLKIARDFVVSDCQGEEGWELAAAIVALGRALNLTVIAEGVEQHGQLGRLRELGCDYVQGFYFSRPLDPVALEVLLAHGGVLHEAADGDAAA